MYNVETTQASFSNVISVDSTSFRNWYSMVDGREKFVDYRGPGFFAVEWFGSFPLPPFSRQKVGLTWHTYEDWERETTCLRDSVGEGARSGGGAQIVGRWEILVLVLVYSLGLCFFIEFYTKRYNSLYSNTCRRYRNVSKHSPKSKWHQGNYWGARWNMIIGNNCTVANVEMWFITCI